MDIYPKTIEELKKEKEDLKNEREQLLKDVAVSDAIILRATSVEKGVKVVKKINTEPQKIDQVTKEVTEEEIKERANEIYLKRQKEGRDGNEKTDWEEAEKQSRGEGVKDLKLEEKIAGDKEDKEEIKKMEELEVQKTNAEKKLGENRENYIKEYKKCKTEADRQKLIEKTRTSTFNILAGVKNIFSKNKIDYKKSIKPEDYFTDKTKEAKTEYTQARIEMGNIMFEQKKAELEKAGLSGKDLETALVQYKATEILAKTITDERQKIIDSKTIEKPALWKRLLDGYMKIKPKWKRVALSTLLFLPLSASGALGASAIAAGGIYAGVAGLAVVKFTASMAIGAGIGHLSKGIDLAKRKSDKEFSENQNKLHQEARDDFANNKIGIEEYEERTKNLEEVEKKRTRDRMILKGVTGGALAMIAGFVAYDAMGNGIEHISGADNTVDAISGPDVSHVQAGPNIEHPTMAPPIIQHANIEATANNGQGGIALAHELKENLKVEYGDNLENAPASVKHALNVSDQDLAKELGMYKPGQEMESANLMEGDKIVVDGKTGEFRFDSIRSDKDTILQHGTEAEPSGVYEGKMVDTDNSGVKIEETPHNTPVSTDEYKIPEQVDPITGEQIINTPHYEPTNLLNDEYKVPEQVDQITGQPIVQEGANLDNSNLNTGKEEVLNTPHAGTSLSTEELHQVEVTVNENIDHLFPDNEHTYAWENVRDKSPGDLFQLEKEGGLNEIYKPLTSYIHKLEEVTGLYPEEASFINPEPETINHFFKSATEEAQRIRKIDEIKL